MKKPLLAFHLTAWSTVTLLAKPMLASISLLYMDIGSLPLPHLSTLDLAIGVLGFGAGAFTFSSRFRNLVIFLQVAILLLRILRHFIKTHPDAQKIPERLKNKVEFMYHQHTPAEVRQKEKAYGTATRIPY